MPLTPEQILKEESARFLDNAFGQLDLTGCPGVQKLTEDKFQAEDRYGLSRVDVAGSGAGSAELKQAVVEVATDPKVLGELKNTDPVIADAIRNAHEESAEEESRKFMRRHPEYLADDSNLELLTLTLASNLLGWVDQEIDEREPDDARDALIAQGYWSAENLERAWDALRSHGLAEVRKGEIKKLSEVEQLDVIRLGQMGMNNRDEKQVLQAVLRYVGYATGYDPDEIEDQFNLPSLRPVIDKAQVFVFEQCVPDYQITSENRAYIKKFIGGRPVSFPLLFAAWKSCQEHERLGFTQSLMADRTPSPSANFDDLDDTEIDSLYHKTMKHIRFRLAVSVGHDLFQQRLMPHATAFLTGDGFVIHQQCGDAPEYRQLRQRPCLKVMVEVDDLLQRFPLIDIDLMAQHGEQNRVERGIVERVWNYGRRRHRGEFPDCKKTGPDLWAPKNPALLQPRQGSAEALRILQNLNYCVPVRQR